MNKLINSPIDYLFLYLYNKESGEKITTIMKTYQIFTFFKKFEEFNYFKPSFYGGEDTILETMIYSSSEYFPIEYNEDETKKIVSINDGIKLEILNNMEKIEKNQEFQKDFSLIQFLSKFSTDFDQKFIIKFCYYFFPEVTTNSVIKDDIAKITERYVRDLFIYFINNAPLDISFELLTRKLDLIIELTLLSEENKNLLKKIIYSNFQNNIFNEILENCKKEVLLLIENSTDIIYQQILRKFLNVLLFNKDSKLDLPILIGIIPYLLKYNPEYQNKDYESFLNMIKNFNLIVSINDIEIE